MHPILVKQMISFAQNRDRYLLKVEIEESIKEAKKLPTKKQSEALIAKLNLLRTIVAGYNHDFKCLTKALKNNWENGSLHFWYQSCVYHGWIGEDTELLSNSIDKIMDELWYHHAKQDKIEALVGNIARVQPKFFDDHSIYLSKLEESAPEASRKDVLLKGSSVAIFDHQLPVEHLKMIQKMIQSDNEIEIDIIDDVEYTVNKRACFTSEYAKLRIMPLEQPESVGYSVFNEYDFEKNKFLHKLNKLLREEYEVEVFNFLLNGLSDGYVDWNMNIQNVTTKQYQSLKKDYLPKRSKIRIEDLK